MTWTQKELEELYQEVVKKSAVDAGFRRDLLDDSVAAMEKVAGKPLPEGFKLKFIERDPSYAATYVLPDFASDELDMKQLQAVSGGTGGDDAASSGCGDLQADDLTFSILAIFTACAAAIEIPGCAADACLAEGCPADAGCAAQACAGDGCGAHGGCAGDACAGDACGADGGCGGDACAGDACGAHGACAGDACAGYACDAYGVCAGEACAGDACGDYGACEGLACAGDSCAAFGGCDADYCPAVADAE